MIFNEEDVKRMNKRHQHREDLAFYRGLMWGIAIITGFYSFCIILFLLVDQYWGI